jgi:lysine-specific demethylase 8
MHFDLTEGLLAQVRGVKHVILCEPVLTPLAPHAWHSRAPHFSGLPARELELERLRARLGGRILELELGPGDVLYIPSPWWHQVRSCTEFNVSINFWWLPRWRRMLRYWNHSLRSIQMEARRRILYGGGLPGEREARRRAEASHSAEAR